jgi:hypothetical protein
MPSPASLVEPRADATDNAPPGLSLADLLDRARLSSDVRMFPLALASALADEVERGRVALDDAGRYRLVADAFDQSTLTALRTLAL